MGERFPQYEHILLREGSELYEVMTQPENIAWQLFVAAELELPPVAAVARQCRELAQRLTSGNRLVGAIACCIAEANGFEKLGKKKAIGVDGYTRGETYRRKSQAPAWLP